MAGPDKNFYMVSSSGMITAAGYSLFAAVFAGAVAVVMLVAAFGHGAFPMTTKHAVGGEEELCDKCGLPPA